MHTVPGILREKNCQGIVFSQNTGNSALILFPLIAVTCHGPITQQMFLHNMGIEVRLQVRKYSQSIIIYFLQKCSCTLIFYVVHSDTVVYVNVGSYYNYALHVSIVFGHS